ncbi:MAG: helix-turn-helix domain-containing protein [Bacteroidales bacterium]|nr:helix-turn-helix domain-containing protein [Bacteroidales bacterium]
MLIWVFPLLVSFNPFYYFYVRSLTDENFQFSKKHLLHYLPSFLALILMFIEYFYAHDNYVSFFLMIKNIFILIYYLQIIAYVTAIIHLLIRHKRKIKEYFSYTENISLSWLWLFLIIYIVFAGFDISMYLMIPDHPYVRVIYYVIMIVFINFLGFFGIKQADIYLQNLYESQKITISNYSSKSPGNEKSSQSTSSTLTEEFKESLFHQILELLKREKIYLNPDLTITTIAKLLNTNYKYISQVINEKAKTNFYNFINEYRIAEATENIKKYKETLTLDAIAQMSGFRSRSTFINAFKKKMNVTPGEFLKNIL